MVIGRKTLFFSTSNKLQVATAFWDSHQLNPMVKMPGFCSYGTCFHHLSRKNATPQLHSYCITGDLEYNKCDYHQVLYR